MSPIGIIHAEYALDSGYVFAKFKRDDCNLRECLR